MRIIQSLIIFYKQPLSCSIAFAQDCYTPSQITKILNVGTLTGVKPAVNDSALVALCGNTLYMVEFENYVLLC